MEVINTVKEAVIKIISKKKKCKNSKWFSEEALQIVGKRREEKRQRKKGKIYPSSKEQQGKIRKPSSVISANK